MSESPLKPPGPAADEGSTEPKVDVKFRVSASERAAAEAIAQHIGLSLPDAMRTCFRRFVLQGGLPFPMVVSSMVREPATEWPRPPATPGRAVLATLGGDRIAALCRRFGVERLAAFGSVTRADYDEAGSDVDLVVRFAAPGPEGAARQYFDFKTALETTLGRPVDLVELTAMPDSRLKREIERTQVPVYGS